MSDKNFKIFSVVANSAGKTANYSINGEAKMKRFGVKVNDKDIIAAIEKEAGEAGKAGNSKKDNKDDGKSDVDKAAEEALREKGKELGIKSSHNMGLDKLKAKIEEAEAEAAEEAGEAGNE
jgi:hypothetical protein